MGKERLWDQGSLCPRRLGTQQGWVWQWCPQPGDTRNRLNSPPSLISWFIGATCLFYSTSDPLCPCPRGAHNRAQELQGNEHLDTSGFYSSTPAAATRHIPRTEVMHRHFPKAPEMSNKGSCQDL